jgi:hypothetical protein
MISGSFVGQAATFGLLADSPYKSRIAQLAMLLIHGLFANNANVA